MVRHTTTRRIFQVKQTNEIQPAKAGRLSRVGGRNRRSAPGGKIFNGRSENGNFNLRRDDGKNHRRGSRNINDGGIHLAVRKHRDGALMLGVARVVVEKFVQRRRDGHRIQQQDKTRQQRGDERLVARVEMTLGSLHPTRYLAETMPDASGMKLKPES
jgi:hypothetical protein